MGDEVNKNIITVYHSTNVVKEKVKFISDILIPDKLLINGMTEINTSLCLEDVEFKNVFVECKNYESEDKMDLELSKIVKNIYDIEINCRIMDMVLGLCFGISLVDYMPKKGVSICLYGNENEKIGYDWCLKHHMKKYGFSVNLLFSIGIDLFGIYKTGDIVNDSEYRSICNKINSKTKASVMYCNIRNENELKRVLYGLSKYLEVMGCLVVRIPIELVKCDIVKLFMISFLNCYMKVSGMHVILSCMEKDNGFDCLYRNNLDSVVFKKMEKIQKLESKINMIIESGNVKVEWLKLFGY